MFNIQGKKNWKTNCIDRNFDSSDYCLIELRLIYKYLCYFVNVDLEFLVNIERKIPWIVYVFKNFISSDLAEWELITKWAYEKLNYVMLHANYTISLIIHRKLCTEISNRLILFGKYRTSRKSQVSSSGNREQAVLTYLQKFLKRSWSPNIFTRQY